MSALPNIEWEPCLLAPTRDEGLEREIKRVFGVVPDWTPYFFSCPWVVRVFNGYFARMSRVITAHRGHVSKFIGDAIQALLGAIERNPWQANDAVHAALAMCAAIEAYGREVGVDLAAPLRVEIGVHRGPVVAGITGSNELMEFTVIGRTVNLASRVERLTRKLGADILVTDAVRRELDQRFELRPLAPEPVQGIVEPVLTYAVEGYRG